MTVRLIFDENDLLMEWEEEYGPVAGGKFEYAGEAATQGIRVLCRPSQGRGDHRISGQGGRPCALTSERATVMATWIEKLYWSAFTVWHSRGERRSLCPCGRTLPTLERLDGRMEDVIVLPDGEAAHESVVLPKLYGVPGVLQIQIFQQTCSEVVIRAVGASDTDDAALRKGLRKAFREAVGGAEGLALTIELVKDIPFLGGKIQGNPIELQMITEFPVLLIPLHPPAEFLGSMP